MRDTAVSGPAVAPSLPLPGFLWDAVDILDRGGVVCWSTVIVPVISFILEVGGAGGVPALILISLPLFIDIFLSIF